MRLRSVRDSHCNGDCLLQFCRLPGHWDVNFSFRHRNARLPLTLGLDITDLNTRLSAIVVRNCGSMPLNIRPLMATRTALPLQSLFSLRRSPSIALQNGRGGNTPIDSSVSVLESCAGDLGDSIRLQV